MNNLNSEKVFLDEKTLNKKNKSVWGKVFFSFFVVYLILFLLFMVMFIFFKSKFVCVPVEGKSMQPTINASARVQEDVKDWVYINKSKAISRGDIVVFQNNSVDSKTLIKRVIALEGEAVTIQLQYSEAYQAEVFTVRVATKEALEDGVLDQSEVISLEEGYTTSLLDWTQPMYKDEIDNGIFIHEQETYLGHTYSKRFFVDVLANPKYETLTDSDGVIYLKVPQGEFFFLGDNRRLSSDSEERGTEKIGTIAGIVEIIIPNAQNEISPLWVQIKAVFGYFFEQMEIFFSGLWKGLEDAFAI